MLAVSDDRVLKFDYRGAPQTMGLLRRAALEGQRHIVVRRCAEFFCRGIDSKDYVSEYLAILYGMQCRTRYMRDPRTVELVRAPHIICEEIMDGGRPQLDCDDQGGAIVSMVLAVGGAGDFATVAFKDQFYRGKRQYSHVFGRGIDPSSGVAVVLDPVAAENTAQMLRRVKAAKIWPVA